MEGLFAYPLFDEMTAKFHNLTIPKRAFLWISLNYRPFSYASAAHVQNHFEDNKNSLDSAEFISAVQALKGGLHPQKLVHVLDSMLDVTSALKAFKWASTQRKFQHTAETYACMILRLGLVGNIEEMEILLNEMTKLQLDNTNQVFGSMIDSFCVNCREVEALLVFRYSILAKQQLSISTCNRLLATFSSQSGNFFSSLFVYKEMVKLGILPDVGTLNYLIKGLCEIGRLDLALNQFHRMGKKRCDPNSLTFEILIKDLCVSNRADEAINVFEQMLKSGCTPHPDFYFNVMPLLCSINRFEEGIKLLRMKGNIQGDQDLYLYKHLIQCLCNNRQLETAVEFLQEIKNSGFTPLTVTYTDVVNGLCKFGKLNEAMTFLDREGILQVEPYNALLKGFCNAGRYREAAIYLKQMSERDLINLASWIILTKGLCEEGLVEKALEVVGKMIVSSYMVEGAVYSAIITGYCKIGKYENALSMFRLSCVYDCCSDSACSQLIEGLCIINKIQEATEIFYHLTAKGCLLCSSSLNELVKGICISGKVQEAIHVRSLAVSSGASCNSVTYCTILLGLLGLDKEKESLVILSQMLVEGGRFDATTYSIFIRGLCSKSLARESANLFNQMVNDNFVPDSETLELLIFSLSRNSQLHMVMHSLDRLINNGGFLSPRVCNMVISGLVKEGQKHEARRFLDRMLERGWIPDTRTHVLLVADNNLEGNSDVFEATDDDKVSKILAEGLYDLDKHNAM